MSLKACSCPVEMLLKYERRDSNPHAFRQRILSASCLPFHHSRKVLLHRDDIDLAFEKALDDARSDV